MGMAEEVSARLPGVGKEPDGGDIASVTAGAKPESGVSPTPGRRNMLAAYQIGLFRQCWTQNREFPFACRWNPYRPARLGAREAQPPQVSATVPIASTTHVGQAHADDFLWAG
jgi:hypothetical protein